MKHLLSPLDLSVDELDELLNLASDIAANPAKYSECCHGKKLATLFYEPSTRTRLRDRKSTRLNSSHRHTSRMPSSA